MKTPLLGGFTSLRSRDVGYNIAINLYPELVETKDGKDVGALYGCAGLDLFGTVGTGPIRGAYTATNGVLYVVSDSRLFSVSTSGVGTNLGTITTSSTGPVGMVDNGTQLLIVDGVGAWVLQFSNLAFTQPLPGSLLVNPSTLAFQDGFAIVNKSGTNQWYQSNLNDFTTWQALNFSSADSTPDQIITTFDLHREVWLFKQKTTEVWINAGLPGFVFQRLQGVQVPQGCAAAYSIARMQDSLIWLGSDEQGAGVVYMSEGYRAKRVSTHSIEFAISKYSTISDAIGYVYQDAGHFFYMLSFPTGNETYCYDVATGLWHQRAAFSNGAFSRHASNCHAFFNNKHIVGDFSNGNLYAFNNATFTDNGAVRKWLRTWRALPPGKESTEPFRFELLQIDCQTGVNIPDGSNPQLGLRWSDDGGFTWSNQILTDGNQPGNTGTRIIFRRLGQTKRGNGLDRIFELTGTDPVPIVLIGGYIDAEPA